MTTPQPQGENLRKAVRWISEKRTENPDQDPGGLAESAAVQFDLSPEDSQFLLRFVKEPKQES